METNETDTKPQSSKAKKSQKQTPLRALKPGAVINWQGRPHIVRGVEIDGDGLARVTLSWELGDSEIEGISFKSSAYDTFKFTTREIAQTIKVDRYVQPKANKQGSQSKPKRKRK